MTGPLLLSDGCDAASFHSRNVCSHRGAVRRHGGSNHSYGRGRRSTMLFSLAALCVHAITLGGVVSPADAFVRRLLDARLMRDALKDVNGGASHYFLAWQPSSAAAAGGGSGTGARYTMPYLTTYPTRSTAATVTADGSSVAAPAAAASPVSSDAPAAAPSSLGVTAATGDVPQASTLLDTFAKPPLPLDLSSTASAHRYRYADSRWPHRGRHHRYRGGLAVHHYDDHHHHLDDDDDEYDGGAVDDDDDDDGDRFHKLHHHHYHHHRDRDRQRYHRQQYDRVRQAGSSKDSSSPLMAAMMRSLLRPRGASSLKFDNARPSYGLDSAWSSYDNAAALYGGSSTSSSSNGSNNGGAGGNGGATSPASRLLWPATADAFYAGNGSRFFSDHIVNGGGGKRLPWYNSPPLEFYKHVGGAEVAGKAAWPAVGDLYAGSYGKAAAGDAGDGRSVPSGSKRFPDSVDVDLDALVDKMRELNKADGEVAEMSDHRMKQMIAESLTTAGDVTDGGSSSSGSNGDQAAASKENAPKSNKMHELNIMKAFDLVPNTGNDALMDGSGKASQAGDQADPSKPTFPESSVQARHTPRATRGDANSAAGGNNDKVSDKGNSGNAGNRPTASGELSAPPQFLYSRPIAPARFRLNASGYLHLEPNDAAWPAALSAAATDGDGLSGVWSLHASPGASAQQASLMRRWRSAVMGGLGLTSDGGSSWGGRPPFSYGPQRQQPSSGWTSSDWTPSWLSAWAAGSGGGGSGSWHRSRPSGRWSSSDSDGTLSFYNTMPTIKIGMHPALRAMLLKGTGDVSGGIDAGHSDDDRWILQRYKKASLPSSSTGAFSQPQQLQKQQKQQHRPREGLPAYLGAIQQEQRRSRHGSSPHQADSGNGQPSSSATDHQRLREQMDKALEDVMRSTPLLQPTYIPSKEKDDSRSIPSHDSELDNDDDSIAGQHRQGPPASEIPEVADLRANHGDLRRLSRQHQQSSQRLSSDQNRERDEPKTIGNRETAISRSAGASTEFVSVTVRPDLLHTASSSSDELGTKNQIQTSPTTKVKGLLIEDAQATAVGNLTEPAPLSQ